MIGENEIENFLNNGNKTMDSEDHKRDKRTYSLNPSINKRLKSKRIEDVRKTTINNIKKQYATLVNGGANSILGLN